MFATEQKKYYKFGIWLFAIIDSPKTYIARDVLIQGNVFCYTVVPIQSLTKQEKKLCRLTISTKTPPSDI